MRFTLASYYVVNYVKRLFPYYCDILSLKLIYVVLYLTSWHCGITCLKEPWQHITKLNNLYGLKYRIFY